MDKPRGQMTFLKNNMEMLLHLLVSAGVALIVFLAGFYWEGRVDVFIVGTALLLGAMTFFTFLWYDLYQQAGAGRLSANLISSVLHGEKKDLKLIDPAVPTCWKVRPCYFQQCPVYGHEHVRCWLVDGTFCRGEHDGGFPAKLDYCSSCEVFAAAVQRDPSREIEERFQEMMQLMDDREKKVEQMYEHSEEQRKMLEYLLELSREALSSLDVDALLELMMKQIIGPSTDFVAFFLRSPEGILELRGQRGFMPEVYPKVVIEDGISLVDEVGRTGQILVSSRIATEPWTGAQFLNAEIPTSVIGVPLVNGGMIIGVLLAGTFRREPYSRSERQVFALAGEQIARALANASMYESVSQMAATDGLTGLVNHRAFFESMERELGRSRRYGRPLSLIMIDIDFFKVFNDEFGHPQGDKVLAEIAKIIHDSVRVVDTAARYGGEEFAVLLPETPYQAGGDIAASALQVAERIRVAVEAHAFEGRAGRRDARVTISLGVAEYPAHADSIPELVESADNALYEAKRLGRNRVELAGVQQHGYGVAAADE